VVKKQTRTYEEIAADLEEQAGADEVSSSDSDDDEAVISNPLNLPLGWDGKPIPFWLYKLHGLNVEYKCDICGGFTYRGPRAFERHFSEWRHTYGMRCLGIPNSKVEAHPSLTPCHAINYSALLVDHIDGNQLYVLPFRTSCT
jgi:splicing factor 3A subunit 3